MFVEGGAQGDVLGRLAMERMLAKLSTRRYRSGLEPVGAAVEARARENLKNKLPDAVASVVEREMRAAYRNPDSLAAKAALEELARRLERQHPGAAASLREGLAETLTIIRLGVPPTLARTLRSTNPIESIEICRDHCRNVKRWQDGKMVLRWCAAGMLEARKQFRRVNGHLHIVPDLGEGPCRAT